MRLRQLEAFRAIMLCQTVTRAADMLFISQPAVTRLLADLEESVGFPLFERTRGRLHPTAEAQLLYEEVDRSLIGVERIARAAHAIKTQQRGSLHVAAPPSMALSFLPRAIAAFVADHGETKIMLGVYDSRSIVDMVIGQRCDLGIVNLSISHTGTHGDSLLSAAHVCAMPVGHRLASKELIVPTDIEGELFICQPSHLGTRLLIDAMFAAYGVKYRAAPVESPVAFTLCSLVAAGQGISLVDAVTAMEYKGQDLRFIPFEPPVPLEFSVLTPLQRKPPKLVEAFLAHLRKFAIAELDPRLVLK
ncbi:LysR family transcriptional regulator [Rhodoferax koreense]|uniref:LysR family transcriptional regulator n=1 Tax=Rhodoferax koreensis TaxID=1842727 RepID=A0A1P8K2B7_9BURK|nr:LysR substrate-binding domain-containing protein [Rhodoferax koreense]APW40164.1 LysR family transcriptional regulator [Rhodoferax koreense]